MKINITRSGEYIAMILINFVITLIVQNTKGIQVCHVTNPRLLISQMTAAPGFNNIFFKHSIIILNMMDQLYRLASVTKSVWKEIIFLCNY